MASRAASPSPATRDRVLAAAAELFAERGFHGTTVRDIAQRARVNLAAGHYHFGSKETLYLEVLRGQAASIVGALEQRGARPRGRAQRTPAALRKLLRARVETMLELVLGPPPGLHARLMQREMCDPSAALPDIVRQFILPHERETESIVAGLIPAASRASVRRCTFSIIGQVLFYRLVLPALPYLDDGYRLSPAWRRGVAEHIIEFSLGGLQRLGTAGGRHR